MIRPTKQDESQTDLHGNPPIQVFPKRYSRHILRQISFSLRHVKDLLREYGNDIRHEPVRFWWRRFGGIVRLNSIAILFRGRRMVSIGEINEGHPSIEIFPISSKIEVGSVA